MKKIAGKIAMILVLLMIANTFSGCITKLFYEDIDYYRNPGLFLFGWILTVPLDIITSPIQITVWAIQRDIEQKRHERGLKMDGIDTFSAVNSARELDSLTRKMSSLPEEKIIPFTEAFNSLSQEENSALLRAFHNLSEEEIASSIKALNELPEERLIATLNSFGHIRREK